MVPNSFPPPDEDVERRRALAKIYSLLIKLAEDSESPHPETDQEQKEVFEPLNNNIPTQGRV